MKKIITVLLIAFFITGCSEKLANNSDNGVTNFPTQIAVSKIKEVRVNTSGKAEMFKKNKEWTAFFDTMMTFDYQESSRAEMNELFEGKKEFYGVSFEIDEDMYWYFIFDDMAIAEYIGKDMVAREEYQYYLAQDEAINAIRENLSKLELSEQELKVAKPVIYIYPREQMDVTVEVNPASIITTSYPRYNNGWAVTATPKGELIDQSGKGYPYLFWEGHLALSREFEDGFIVQRDELIDFLEDKLVLLGLNYKEKADFITYWLPILEAHEYNKIRFYTKEIDELAALEIDPAPETLIRFYMIFEEASDFDQIEPQELMPMKRKGYTVVEWGGAEIKSMD